MGKREKRLAKIKTNPRGVRPEELAQLLVDFDFVWDGGKGDHRVFRHADGRKFSLDFGRDPVRKPYVEAVLSLLKEV